MVKKKIITYVLLFILTSLVTIWFIPFSYTTKDGNEYCRYQFAVYSCMRIESEGEGYGSSDTYFGSLILEKKVGGILEYFGLKEIKSDTNNQLPN